MEDGVYVIGAPWCASCKVLKRQLAVPFTYVDIEAREGEEFVEALGDGLVIRSLPTTLIFKDGLVTGLFVGLKHKEIGEAYDIR